MTPYSQYPLPPTGPALSYDPIFSYFYDSHMVADTTITGCYARTTHNVEAYEMGSQQLQGTQFMRALPAHYMVPNNLVAPVPPSPRTSVLKDQFDAELSAVEKHLLGTS